MWSSRLHLSRCSDYVTHIKGSSWNTILFIYGLANVKYLDVTLNYLYVLGFGIQDISAYKDIYEWQHNKI